MMALMEVRLYELLRVLDLCGHGQIKQVSHSESRTQLRHNDERFDRLLAAAVENGWAERGEGWAKITPAGLRAIDRFEPTLLADILVALDRPANFITALNGLRIDSE